MFYEVRVIIHAVNKRKLGVRKSVHVLLALSNISVQYAAFLTQFSIHFTCFYAEIFQLYHLKNEHILRVK